MMSAKLATLSLLKGYDDIISVYDVLNKNLSRDSNLIVDVVMSPKFGNCRTSMREVVMTSILLGFDQKNHVF